MKTFIDFLTNPILGEYNWGLGIFSAIAGVAIYFGYLLYCYLKFGITKSDSYTYYLHESAKYDFLWWHNLRWVFQWFMFASALCLFGIGQNGWYLITAIFFAAMTLFPSVEYKNFIYPHCVFATLGIVSGIVGLPICFNEWLILICVIAFLSTVLIFLLVKQRPTMWDGESNETTKLYWIENTTIPLMIIGLILGVCLKFL